MCRGRATDGKGVSGASYYGEGVSGSSDINFGVRGVSTNGGGVNGVSTNGKGVSGFSEKHHGVSGSSASGYGVDGSSYNREGVYGWSHYGVGVWGVSDEYIGVYASTRSNQSYAAYLDGRVYIRGPLEKPGGSFKIDHPLDPANKYLYHSFVESPDMKNIYDGVLVLDANGEAEIDLPDWFGALNKDFRYQLTAIGAPGPNLYIVEEISEATINYTRQAAITITVASRLQEVLQV